MATHETVVRDWLKALGMLCAGTASVKECQAKAAAYVPMLAREFRTEAFTTTSLAAVARQCNWFPSYGELCKALSEWWQDNGPEANVPLITGPAQDAWRARVEAERAEAQRDWAQPEVVRRAAASLDGHPMRLPLGRMLAALVNRHAPQNLGWLPPAFLTHHARRGAPDE